MSIRHRPVPDRYLEMDHRFHSVKDLALAYPPFGVAAGFFPSIRAESKFGHNGDVGTSLETLWPEGGIYVYVDVPTTMTISSSDVNDDAGDAGAITVQIDGLGKAYGPISEIATLNGQSGVTLGNKFLRVHRMRVLTAGASLQNEGSIYVGTGSISTGKPAVVHAVIEPGMNQTLQAAMTIPLGHTAYLMDYEFGSSIAKTVTGIIVARKLGEVFQVKDYRELRDGESGPTPIVIDVFEAKTDVEMRAKTAGGGGDITGHMDFWMEMQ